MLYYDNWLLRKRSDDKGRGRLMLWSVEMSDEKGRVSGRLKVVECKEEDE